MRLKLDDVTLADVQALVSERIPESRYLDYKRDLPGRGSDAKKEFLADVTSFANAGGGAIVFGIAEEKDAAGKNTGIPEAVVGLTDNIDAETLRLEQWLQTGVEPRLPAHRFHGVETTPGVEVLVLVIAQSWLGPHMVATADSRFYARNSAGKYPLDVAEIRSAFLQSEAVPDRFRRFRDERLGLIASAETPVKLRDGGKVVLHVVPLAQVGRAASVDMQAWAKQPPSSLDGSTWGAHFNADGHLGFVGNDERGFGGYLQLLRTGAVEAVIVYDQRIEGLSVMNIWHVEMQAVAGLKVYLPALERIGAEAPVSVALSLINVRGFGLLKSAMRGTGGRPVVARDVVALPDVLVERFDADPVAFMRPVFDALWQTFGVSRSLCYDDNGNWNPEGLRW